MKSPNLLVLGAVLTGVATLSFVALPAAADPGGDAAAESAPIKIDHCMVGEAVGMDNPKIGLRMPSAGGLTIVYTVDGDVAASEVRFRARYGAKTFTFVDRGAIAPHRKISREFNNFSAVYYGSSADCGVTSATFADGTRWDAPTQPQATPASRQDDAER